METENRMVFYQTLYDLASLLPEAERRKVLTAMLDYFFEGVEPIGLSANGMKVFNGVRGRIDASKAKANNRRGKTRSKTRDEHDNETDNKTDNKHNNKRAVSERIDKSPSPSPSFNPYPQEGVQGGMEPPTLEDVRTYFAANCLRGDPDLFWANYDAKGWLDGNGFAISKWTSQALKWSRMQVERDAKTPERDRAPTAPKQMTDAEMDAEIRRLKDFLGEGEAA